MSGCLATTEVLVLVAGPEAGEVEVGVVGAGVAGGAAGEEEGGAAAT